MKMRNAKKGQLVTGYYGDGVGTKVVRVVGPLSETMPDKFPDAHDSFEVVEYQPNAYNAKSAYPFYGVRNGDNNITVAGPKTIAKEWTPPAFDVGKVVKLYVNDSAKVCENSVYVERKIDAKLRKQLMAHSRLFGKIVYAIPGNKSKRIWYYEPRKDFTIMAISTIPWRNVRADES
jgi:hypothetical protein